MNVTNVKAGQMLCPIRKADSIAPDRWTCCLSDDCMMWRWFDAPTKTIVDIPASHTPNGEPVTHDEPRKDRKGYCGLAGRPNFVE